MKYGRACGCRSWVTADVTVRAGVSRVSCWSVSDIYEPAATSWQATAPLRTPLASLWPRLQSTFAAIIAPSPSDEPAPAWTRRHHCETTASRWKRCVVDIQTLDPHRQRSPDADWLLARRPATCCCHHVLTNWPILPWLQLRFDFDSSSTRFLGRTKSYDFAMTSLHFDVTAVLMSMDEQKAL